MNTKEERIALLEIKKAKKIAELEAEIAKLKDETYVLDEVLPDCGGGIADTVNELAVSKNIETLIKYCEEKYSYSPSLSYKRPEGDKEFCKTWYRILPTNLIIL